MTNKLISFLCALLGKDHIHLVDVGARGGRKSPWHLLKNNLTVVGFEPEITAYEKLTKNNSHSNGVKFTYLPHALWSKEEPVSLNITVGKGKSSIYEPNFPYLKYFNNPERYNIVERLKMEAKTLDSALASVSIDADFIKLDCQGADFDILKGGVDQLSKNVFGLEVEVLYNPIYKNCPLFHDIDQYLQSKGFALFDLKNTHWKRRNSNDLGSPKGQLIFGDALYLRFDESSFTAADRRQLICSLIICALYGYLDFLKEILEKNSHYLSREELSTLNHLIHHQRNGKYLGLIPFRRKFVMKLWKAVWKMSKFGDPSQGCTNSLGNRFE